MIKRRQLTALLVSFMFALGLYPVPAFAAVEIGSEGGSLSEGTGNLTGTRVYFGEYGGSAIPWNVVATDAGTATLWTTTDVTGGAGRQYDSSAHNYWSGSAICAWLNGTTSGTLLYDAFSSAEQAAMVAYGTTEQANPAIGFTTDIDISQKIVLPSVSEMGDMYWPGTWGINDSTRDSVSNMYWWLRSPGGITSDAAIVYPFGYIHSPGLPVSFMDAVFPAFKLNLSSVIFTSAASGASSKSVATVGSGLVEAQSPASAAVKLTLLDTMMATPSLTLTSGNGTSAINFDYTDAITGVNQYLSCTLTDSLGNLVYYGKLADCATAADGSFTLNLTGVSNGIYTLDIFCEQENGDYLTDYAGAAEQYTINVTNGAGNIPFYTVTVNLIIDDVAANATSVTLDTTTAGASPVAMTPGATGIYTLANIPGEILHLFVNDVYTGVVLSNSPPAAYTANVALYTVNFAATSIGTGTTGPITAAYAASNPVVENRGLPLSSGDLAVAGSIVTFSVAGAAATDTIAWGGGATSSSNPSAASTNVTFSAPVAQVTCAVNNEYSGSDISPDNVPPGSDIIPKAGDASLPIMAVAVLLFSGGALAVAGLRQRRQKM